MCAIVCLPRFSQNFFSATFLLNILDLCPTVVCPDQRFSSALQIFSCSLTVKTTIIISKKMNNYYDLKFACNGTK